MISMDSLKKMVSNYGNRVGIVKRQDGPQQLLSKREKEDGLKKAQKILLTWMIDDISLFKKIAQYIGPEDFIEPIFNHVAVKLYEQLENGMVNPAAIINMYESEEEHKEVASLFNSALSDELSDSEKEKALNETVVKVKKNSLDYKSRNINDIQELQKIIKEQKQLQKLHIEL